jgi:hypothetical protein
MYSTCLFCHRDLGANELVASLPVGRRIAFDGVRGRLWVVCTRCGRWNLTPFEERWEALEECERLFRGTRLRVGTDNIGLAQPGWGFELVRIGAALRPEIAAWRYGGKLLKRATSLAAYAGRLGANRRAVMTIRTLPRRHDVLARVRTGGGRLTVRWAHLANAELLRPERDEVWRVQVRHDRGTATLHGGEAMKVSRAILTALNDGRASEWLVQSAIERLDDAANSQSYFGRVGALAINSGWGRTPAVRATMDAPLPGETASLAERLILRLTTRSFWSRGGTGSEERTPLHWLPDVDRLALEMAANEDAERRALRGELRQLQEAWREAEEVAAIADHLLDEEAV